MSDDFHHDEEFQEYPELPISVRDIAETLGLEVVIKLVQHFGGTEIKIPHKFPQKPDHKLLVLGNEHVQALCDFCGGGELKLPRRLNAKPFSAQDIIDLRLKENLKDWQIARKLNINQRSVRRIMRKHRQRLIDNENRSAGQLSFFDQ